MDDQGPQGLAQPDRPDSPPPSYGLSFRAQVGLLLLEAAAAMAKDGADQMPPPEQDAVVSPIDAAHDAIERAAAAGFATQGQPLPPRRGTPRRRGP